MRHNGTTTRMFEKDFSGERIFIVTALIASIIIGALIFSFTKNYYEESGRKLFVSEVEETTQAMERRIEKYENALRSGVAFFQGSRKVSRDEWRWFVTTLETEKFYPGVQGVGYTMMLKPAEVEPTIRRMRIEGYPSFTLRPAGKREEYSSILYLEPMDKRNIQAIGYDMYADPVRREAMRFARDSGTAAISGKVHLVQEIDTDVQAGFLMYLPLYKRGSTIDTVEERRKALVGFVYSPFRIKELIKSLNINEASLDYEIYDGEISEKNLLYRGTNHPMDATHYHHDETIQIGGRIWNVRYSSTDAFDAAHASGQHVVLSLAIFLFYLFLMSIIFKLLHNRKILTRKRDELQQASIQLRESEEFYRTIFASVSEAIFILSDKIIVDCNDLALSIFEMNKEEIIGKNIHDLSHNLECGKSHFHSYLNAVHQGESPTTICTLSINKKDIKRKILEFTLSMFGSQNENKIIMIVRDISSRVEEEKLLKMSARQAQMGEMISVIAHQWRQPLAIINAITAQIRIKLMMTEENDCTITDKLITIEEQSSHLSQTISEYRDFFHPNKPKEFFYLSALLTSALNLVDYALRNHSIAVEIVIDNDPKLFSYRNEILQVLIALLKNSLDAFEEKSISHKKILITIDYDGEYGTIVILDNGGGISAEIVEKVFLPYFTTKNNIKGTGLGLYMSKMIIEGHCHGSIHAHNENEYAVFTIKLPLENEQ